MEFKEGHSEDMKITCKLSEQEERFAGVLCGKGLSVLKDAKSSKRSKVKSNEEGDMGWSDCIFILSLIYRYWNFYNYKMSRVAFILLFISYIRNNA